MKKYVEITKKYDGIMKKYYASLYMSRGTEKFRSSRGLLAICRGEGHLTFFLATHIRNMKKIWRNKKEIWGEKFQAFPGVVADLWRHRCRGTLHRRFEISRIMGHPREKTWNMSKDRFSTFFHLCRVRVSTNGGV